MKFSIIGIIFSVGLTSGCVSSTKQADLVLGSTQKLYSTTARIPDVPFINQSVGQCGPATLTMAMNAIGKNLSVEEIASQVYTPGMKGTLQTDMITGARRQGLIAIPIDSLDSLLKEVAAGNTVIIFENLALTWFPQWHYALVFGYDLSREVVIMHSGPEQNKEWDIRKFERSWKLGDYWGLLVLPPNKLSQTGNEISHANASVSLEQFKKTEEAKTAYLAMLNRWPKSLSALIGLGNLEFEKKNYINSVAYLKTATHEHPHVSSAWHNLAIAENAARMTISSKKSARRALELVPSNLRAQYEVSLNAILK